MGPRGQQLAKRNGSRKDFVNLIYLFEVVFGFSVRPHYDPHKVAAEEDMKTVASENYASMDCAIVVFMSHGTTVNGEHVVYCADGETINVSSIIERFNGEHSSPSLRGKPKFFIIQSCRGSDTDKGFQLESGVETDSGTPTPPTLVPKDSDMLVMKSTTDNLVSYRDRENHGLFRIS